MLNWFVLVGSAITGFGSGWATRRVLAARGAGAAAAVGTIVGITGSGLMLISVTVSLGADAFALLHVGYGVVTVAVPIAAGVVALAWRVLPIWGRVAVVCGVMAAPLGLYATHIEPFWLRVDRAAVDVAAAGDGGIRIGVLADLQTPEIGDYELRAIEALLAEQPDIVLIPGDFWQFRSSKFGERVPQFAAVMQQLGASVPHVFAVNGNTDRVGGLRLMAEGSGVVVLDNEMVEIDLDGVAVRILGISFDRPEDGLPAAIEAFQASTAGPVVRVVLAHQPDEIDRFGPADQFDLLVAGHTHGGQVAIPFFGPPITLSSVPRSVAAGGLHDLDGRRIYVSTGVGRERHHAPQVRFGVRPSIGILDLVAVP